MNITIIGAGHMARGIAIRALAGGHSVTIHSRKPDAARELAGRLSPGAAKGAKADFAGIGSTVNGEIVVLAVPYGAVADVLKTYGDKLKGKVLVDISNPLNWTTMDPVTPAGSSGGEEIAKLAPRDAHVVKAFNTIFAETLDSGTVAGQPLDVFIAGDDQAARQMVMQLVKDGGLRPLDAGPLKRSRNLELMLVPFISVQPQISTPRNSALKVIP